MKEILTIGKVAWEVKERHYDLVVVDSVASGHIIGQLTAPQGINELVQVGVVRNQTQWMLDILTDPAQTGVVIVSAPEEMPVAETIELADRLNTETKVDLAAVVVNRVLPELFTEREEALFEVLRTPEQLDALTAAAGRRRHPGVRRRRAGRHAAPHPGRAPRHAPTGARPDAAPHVRPVPVHPQPRRPCHPQGGRTAGGGALMASKAKVPAAGEKARTLEQLLATKEIVISCGSGGVGKTTTAAAAAAMAATHLGGKVLVLTVDPAKRLANALGLERFGNVETRVPDSAFASRRHRASR